MNDLAQGIIGLLERFGSLSAMRLRERLPRDLPRGEPFDLTLNQLLRTQRLQTHFDDDGKIMYRLAIPPPDAGIPIIEVKPILAPGPSAAVSAAFNPPPPSIRVPAAAPGVDEIPARRERERKSMRITADQVLQALKKPMTTAEIANELGANAAAVGWHLKTLGKTKKVHKPEGRMGPWALLNGHGTAKPIAAAPKVAAKKRVPPRPASLDPMRHAVGDFGLKVKTLEACIDEAKAASRNITAFILAEIRDDLERMAA